MVLVTVVVDLGRRIFLIAVTVGVIVTVLGTKIKIRTPRFREIEKNAWDKGNLCRSKMRGNKESVTRIQ